MMKRCVVIFTLLIIGMCGVYDTAFAGMPIFSLTEIARLRLSTISFFLLVYLLVSFGILKLWNMLQKDFSVLPKLSFRRALALVFLWGLAFHLVLVMIAGTRELMTPEAWQKAGVIHKLSPDEFEQLLQSRRYKLERLKDALWHYAQEHDGQFPQKHIDSNFPQEAWISPTGKERYVYVPDLSLNNQGMKPLAYEPAEYGQERLILFSNGIIELLSLDAIQQMLKEGGV
jgi:hypothetical protein